MITLNVQQEMLVFSSSESAAMSVAYSVIPATARMSITDGLHRKSGIEFGYDLMTDAEREEFSTHSISVMITFEDKLGQIHQDFADCSKTKPLPPSLVAAFDRRNPANGIVLDLIESVELFNDKVDSTSKTLGKNSNMLFLVNHIRQYVKELLVGDWAMANIPFEAKAEKQLGKHNSADYSNQLSKFIEYTEEVVNLVTPYDILKDLPRGPERMLIAQKRNEGWLSMSAMGLIILGRVGHILIRDNIPFSSELKKKIREVNWSRDAEFWQGNIVMDGRILTARIPTKKAMKKLLEHLNIGENYLLEWSTSDA